MKRPPNKKIIQALKNNHGFLINTAEELEISRMSLYNWISKDEELQQAVEQSKEALKDKVEHQLMKNIMDGKETSIIFFMKTKMKDRGYSQDIENAMTFNQLNITVQSEESRIIMDNIIKKISNE